MQKSPYLFHGADVSYFSGKLRPALPQKNLWYREVVPNLKEIVARTGVAFIPILVTPDGEAWQDTSTILDRLEAAHPSPPLYPTTPVQRVVAYLIELYGDEIGLLPAMHYRWSFEESAQKARVDFALGSGNLAAAGQFADRMVQGKNSLGVSAATRARDRGAPARAARRAVRALRAAPLPARRFDVARGLRPDGPVLRPPVPRRGAATAAARERLPRLLLDRAHEPAAPRSAGLAPERRARRDPEARAAQHGGRRPAAPRCDPQIDAWADANPDAAPPRVIGTYETPYRDVKLSLLCRPYTLWMVQRPLDAYAALTAAERAQVDAALDGTGWGALLACRPRHRMGKRRNELALER